MWFFKLLCKGRQLDRIERDINRMRDEMSTNKEKLEELELAITGLTDTVIAEKEEVKNILEQLDAKIQALTDAAGDPAALDKAIAEIKALKDQVTEINDRPLEPPPVA